jgi:hypothetical protein
MANFFIESLLSVELILFYMLNGERGQNDMEAVVEPALPILPAGSVRPFGIEANIHVKGNHAFRQAPFDKLPSTSSGSGSRVG